MSTAGISFGGLASGLDTKAIISALVAVEERPIRQLEIKKSSLNKQKSLFGDLKGLLDKLTTAAKALKSTTDFLAMKASTSDDKVMTATASSTASPGSYTFTVDRLATAQVNASTGSSSATSTIAGTGFEFMIDVGGNQVPITVGDPPTLEAVANAINGAGLDVRAQVVDTGNPANGGANRYQLVLSASETGSEGGFSLSIDPGEDAGAIAFINDVVAGVKSPAQDAEITLNGGISVFRSSNTVGDLIPGVTLDLKAASAPSTSVTITVTTDGEETSKKVQEFVDAYNKVVDFFAEQNKLDAEGKASSPLFGDVTLRGIRSSLRTIVGGQVAGTGNSAYQLFSQIGITSDTAGKLTFNRSKFEEALAADENAVARIFTDPTAGMALRLEEQIDLYTDSVEGLIKTRTEGFDRQVKNTTDRIEQAERRLELYQKQLETKYANLESLLSKLQGQGSGLSSLASLNSSR